MIQIESDRVNRPLYRTIVKTIADIAVWLSKHSLSIFLIGSKGLSSGAGPALPRQKNATALLMFYFVFI